jgi:hypothetical protein
MNLRRSAFRADYFIAPTINNALQKVTASQDEHGRKKTTNAFCFRRRDIGGMGYRSPTRERIHCWLICLLPLGTMWLAVKDVPLDPVSVFNNFNTSAAGGPGDGAGCDRGTDLGDGPGAFTPTGC